MAKSISAHSSHCAILLLLSWDNSSKATLVEELLSTVVIVYKKSQSIKGHNFSSLCCFVTWKLHIVRYCHRVTPTEAKFYHYPY